VASDIQSVIQYAEPPFWYYPVRQTLGAAVLMDGQPARAERAFLATLVENQDTACAFWGLGEARKPRGGRARAEAARVLFRAV
jgi:predicted Zn-dependent protease